MFTRRCIVSALMAICLPLSAAAQEVATAPAALGDGWAVAEPAEAGLDPDALAALVEKIDGGGMPNVHAVLIEHKGRLVFERYWPGEDENWGQPLGRIEHGPTTQHDLRSVTKSVTSVLLGIALGETADAALARPIASFFPDREGLGVGLDTVTLHHVLTMTAGLEWNEMVVPYTDSRNDEIRLYVTDDPIGLVLARAVRNAPGSQWYYNGGLTQLIAGVIENLTGEPLDTYAEEVLFSPLGITDYTWHRSMNWSPDSSPSAASGLRLRARDLAKIGSLILNDGKWQGRQVVPADWVAASTTRHVQDNPWGPPGVYGYGYFWYPGTLRGGQRVVRAVGNGDQRIFVLPDAQLAITVFAGNYNDFSHLVGERIMGLIIDALQ
ncbi:MAG: serine hydrolase domain-containing protein [Ruegeria sp.]